MYTTLNSKMKLRHVTSEKQHTHFRKKLMKKKHGNATLSINQ